MAKNISLLCVLTCMLLAGCSSSPAKCIPGASVECACNNGTRSAQTCSSDGTYQPCDCAAAATSVAPSAVDRKTSPPCSLEGTWSLKVSWGKGTCGGKQKPYNYKFAVVLKDGTPSLRSMMNGNAPKLISSTQNEGACSLKISSSSELCPSCVPFEGMGTTTYELNVVDSDISGSGQYKEHGGYEKKDCKRILAISGKRTPTKKEDMVFDRQAASAYFKDFIKTSECDVPSTRELLVEVAPNGGFTSVTIRGKRYDLRKVCLEKYLSFLEFSNPSGELQTLSVHL